MRVWLLLLSVIFASTALAASPASVRKQVEASMLVTGRVTVELDGSVSAWEVDQREKLPSGVAKLVDGAVEQWKFEPVLIDGKPTRGRARMSLLVVADPLDDGRYEISIRSGNFGREALNADELKQQGVSDYDVSSMEMKPPSYPARAQNVGAQGTVYLVIRVGRQGTVEEVAVEQVNLRVAGSAQQMKTIREVFGNSAMTAARGWTFRTPTKGEWADAEDWTVRVPVAYSFYGSKVAGYGEWEAYIPGPRSAPPWQMESLEGFDIAPDALIAGEVHQAGTGLKLLTPLQGS